LGTNNNASKEQKTEEANGSGETQPGIRKESGDHSERREEGSGGERTTGETLLSQNPKVKNSNAGVT
jgi:hypothetical protein